MFAQGLEAIRERLDEFLARIALHIEYRNDSTTLAALAGDPPVRLRLVRAAEVLLSRIGITEPGKASD